MRTIVRSGALVEAWFDNLRPEQQDMGRLLRDAVMAAAPTLGLSIKWGNLMFTHEGKHALAIVTHRDHANLQVFNGASLLGEFPELEGSGRSLRHLKFRYRHPIDEALVREVTRACVEELEQAAKGSA